MMKSLAILLIIGGLCSLSAETFILASPAFDSGAKIPKQHTPQGDDISPPLIWKDPPEGVQSYALVVDDPDAEGWVHWIVFDIPGDWTKLPADLVYSLEFPRSGIDFGRNSWKGTTWRGPNPYDGQHRYLFKLYALDTKLDLELSPTKKELEKAMDDHILGIAVLDGVYERE